MESGQSISSVGPNSQPPVEPSPPKSTHKKFSAISQIAQRLFGFSQQVKPQAEDEGGHCLIQKITTSFIDPDLAQLADNSSDVNAFSRLFFATSGYLDASAHFANVLGAQEAINNHMQGTLSSYPIEIDAGRVVFDTVGFLGEASQLILSIRLLEKAKEIRSLKKGTPEEAKWDALIKQQTKLMKNRAKQNALHVALVAPRITGVVLRLAGAAGTTVATVASGAALGASAICYVLELKQNKANLENHKDWEKEFQLQNQVVLQLEADKISQVIARQPVIEKQKISPFADEGTRLIRCMKLTDSNEKTAEIAAIRETLKTKGLIIPDDCVTPEDMLTCLQEKEATLVSLRNILTDLAARKARVDRDLINFRKNWSQVKVAVVTLFMASWVGVKIAAAVTAAGALSALGLIGFGLMAFVAVGLVVGLVYFYIKKPNLFQAYLKGVPLNILVRKIPLAIQRYRTKATALKFFHLVAKTGDQSNAVERKKIENTITKLQKLEASVQKQEKKIEALRGVLQEAGWKDFKRNANISETTRDGSALSVEAVLAERLSQPEVKNDQAVIQGLLAKMGIKIPTVAEDAELKLVLEQNIKIFFGMESEDVISMIKRETTV